MTTATPTLQFAKNAKNTTAIRAYWLVRERAVRERAFGLFHNANVTYLVDTGRMTEEEGERALSHPPPVETALIQLRCDKARHADGDLTLWSDPPKTWLRETA